MKKIFLLLMTLVLASGVGWAADVAYKTVTFTSATQPNNSAYTGTYTVTIGSDTWSVFGFNNNNNGWDGVIKCGRKNVASTASITTDDALSDAVTKVSITFAAVADCNSAKLKVATDSDFSNVLQEISFTPTANTTVDIPVTTPTANCYYQIYFDMAATSNNKNGTLGLSQVVYYKAEQTNQLSAPTFDPAGGVSNNPATINKGVDITIEMPADGEVLHYTVNGGTEQTASADATISTSAFAHRDTIALTAYATATGKTDSDEATAYYVVHDPNFLYAVNVDNNIEHGSVSVDLTDAAAGSTVTVTATPDDGYVLNTIFVVDADDNPVTVTGNTFEMPASDVTVSATFKEEDHPARPGETVVFEYGKNKEFAQNNGEVMVQSSKGGITIDFDKAEGNNDPKWYEITNGNARVYLNNTITIDAGSLEIESVTFTYDGNYAFSNPSVSPGDFYNAVWTVGATSGVLTSDKTVRISTISVKLAESATTNYTVSVAEGCENYLVTDQEVYSEGDIVEFMLVVPDHHSYSDLTATKENGGTVDITFNEDTQFYEFEMPADNVTLSVNVTPDPTYTITTVAEHGSIAIANETDTYYGGELIEFSVAADQDYEINSVTAVNGDGNEIEDFIYENGSGMFTMPHSNVTITATFIDIPTFSITTVADNGMINIANDAATYRQNDEIEFSISANEGYEFSTLTVVDSDNNPVDFDYDASENFGMFIMPASNVTMTATFTQIQTGNQYTVYVLDVQNGTSTPTPNIYAWYVENDSPTTITAGWPGNALDPNEIEGLPDGNNWYKVSFTAPNLNVIVNRDNNQTSDIAVDGDTIYIKYDSSKGQGENAEVSYSAPEPLTYNITTVADHGVINITNSPGIYYGDETVEFSIDAEPGYVFSSLSVVDDNNESVEYEYDAIENYGLFIMPRSNVTMTATFMEVPNSYTVYVLNEQSPNTAPNLYAWDDNGNHLNGEWPGTAMDETEVLADNNTWFKKNIAGHSLNVIVNTNGNQDQTENIGVEQDVIYIVYKSNEAAAADRAVVSYTAPEPATYTISTVAEHGRIDILNDGTEFISGDLILFTVAADQGYHFESIAAVDANDNEVVLSEEGEGGYSFNMPAANVTITATFASDYTEMSLGDALDNGVDGEYYRITGDLTVVCVTEDEQHIYCVDDNNRWVRLDADRLDLVMSEVLQGSVFSNVVGLLTTHATAPGLSLLSYDLETKEVNMSNYIDNIDLRNSFDIPAPSQVVTVTGYYFGGDLRGWMSDPKGQSFTIGNNYANEFNFTEGERYKVKVAVELKQAWDKSSDAPRKVKPTDQDSFQNLTGQMITSQADGTVPTGIEGIDYSGKTVKSVRYYNLTGVESNKPFQGVNIVTTEFTDGSSQTVKVIR